MPDHKHLVVCDARRPPFPADLTVVSADDYLEGKDERVLTDEGMVVNLCRSYAYLSKGYYVSLLAEARNQPVLPTPGMIEDISSPFTYLHALRQAGVETIDFKVVKGRRVLPRLIVPTRDRPGEEGGTREDWVTRASDSSGVRYEPVPGEAVEVTTIFGRTLDRRFRKHGAAVFRVYPFPLLGIRLYREEERWNVGQLVPRFYNELSPAETELLLAELREGDFARVDTVPDRPVPDRLAVLMSDDESYSPSDDLTLGCLRKAGARQGLQVERIGRQDLTRLGDYDALFIRTVTGLDHYSFAFAQKAESLGIPVIDRPESTMRCSNKVYLHELFARNRIRTPRTLSISGKSPIEEIEALGYPVIVKQPDGTSSAAVKKASDRQELEKITGEMFQRSPLLIVQEFTPTDFDWRIGILDGEPLFACRYFMVKGHWQVAARAPSGRARYGRVDAVSIESVPPPVIALALEAASLIGDGLFGVDVKEAPTGPAVIEVNDNPDLWVREEDAVEGERLYSRIIQAFRRRIQQSRAET